MSKLINIEKLEKISVIVGFSLIGGSFFYGGKILFWIGLVLILIGCKNVVKSDG